MDTVAQHKKSFDIKGFLAFQGPGGADLPSTFRPRPAPFFRFRGCVIGFFQLWGHFSVMKFSTLRGLLGFFFCPANGQASPPARPPDMGGGVKEDVKVVFAGSTRTALRQKS